MTTTTAPMKDCDRCGEEDAVHDLGSLQYCESCWQKCQQEAEEYFRQLGEEAIAS